MVHLELLKNATGMNKVKFGLLSVLMMFLGNMVFAQAPPASVSITPIYDTDNAAKEAPAPKEVGLTLDQLKAIYERLPDSVYNQYLYMLIEAKQYKDAEKVVQAQMAHYRQDPCLHIDLGDVYAWEKKYDKARQQYDSLLRQINGDDMFTQRVAKAFTDAGNDDYAILTYEIATRKVNTPLYTMQLAKLYGKCGNLDKAIEALLTFIPGQGVYLEAAKTTLLEIMGNDPVKLQQAQKAIVRKINNDPGNAYYAELLTWVFTQKNDWDGALIQIEAVDERNKEGGRRVMDLAHLATNAKQYETAAKAFDDVIAQGKDAPYYLAAESERLNVAFLELKSDTVVNADVLNNLLKLYDSTLTQYPRLYSTQTTSEYATLEAQYAGNAPKAIEILQKALIMPDIRTDMAGRFKLQMGDYYLLCGQVWDASLTYSQVDKQFKQDPMGEDARFRNAKLAYYRGDFEWAQKQLSILKASTSELIANDALYLSVLITENVEDSNYYPLERFAYADLLLFQNKDKEAEALLDSINKAFPKHPLNDDIIMLRADLATKRHDYIKALSYLKTIYEQYGQDVLGDDAVFKTADIYQNYLHQTQQAKHFYEQLIIDYPGSTYVQTARQKLAEINNGVIP